MAVQGHVPCGVRGANAGEGVKCVVLAANRSPIASSRIGGEGACATPHPPASFRAVRDCLVSRRPCDAWG